MNNEKYRKIFLENNWANNAFSLVKYKADYKKYNVELSMFDNNISIYHKMHPLIKNGSAYWLNSHELCIGYISNIDPNIFRPIFSHRRQRILDTVNLDVKKSITFWNRIKSRYYYTIAHKKELPLDIIEYIVEYIY